MSRQCRSRDCAKTPRGRSVRYGTSGRHWRKRCLRASKPSSVSSRHSAEVQPASQRAFDAEGDYIFQIHSIFESGFPLRVRFSSSPPMIECEDCPSPYFSFVPSRLDGLGDSHHSGTVCHLTNSEPPALRSLLPRDRGEWLQGRRRWYTWWCCPQL